MNKYRITLKQYMEENGYENLEELLLAVIDDSSMPALCTEECCVEPDGTCPHGCPSILLATGMI